MHHWYMDDIPNLKILPRFSKFNNYKVSAIKQQPMGRLQPVFIRILNAV